MANAKSPSRWLGPVFVLCAVIALTASCGGDDLDAQTVGSSTPPGGGACGTPQEGCPCTSPGTAIACGKQVVQGPSSFLYCYEGTRVCGADGKYGPCADGALTVRSTNALSIGTGGLETRSYGTSQACNSYGAGGSDAGASDSGTVDAGSGEIDPCDPYCTVRSDTPAGLSFDAGFGLVEGGLAVVSLTDGGVVPSSPQSTANGDSLCGGAANVHATTCSTPADCQQDFSCVAGQCKWNGGPGYFDGTVATPDLTVGAACDFSGSPVVPVCNRGSAPVAAGTILGVNIVNAVENGCTANYPSRDCAVTVGTGGLPPGACVNIGGCPISGDQDRARQRRQARRPLRDAVLQQCRQGKDDRHAGLRDLPGLRDEADRDDHGSARCRPAAERRRLRPLDHARGAARGPLVRHVLVTRDRQSDGGRLDQVRRLVRALGRTGEPRFPARDPRGQMAPHRDRARDHGVRLGHARPGQRSPAAKPCRGQHPEDGPHPRGRRPPRVPASQDRHRRRRVHGGRRRRSRRALSGERPRLRRGVGLPLALGQRGHAQQLRLHRRAVPQRTRPHGRQRQRSERSLDLGAGVDARRARQHEGVPQRRRSPLRDPPHVERVSSPRSGRPPQVRRRTSGEPTSTTTASPAR